MPSVRTGIGSNHSGTRRLSEQLDSGQASGDAAFPVKVPLLYFAAVLGPRGECYETGSDEGWS
ncbi:hypothetical protein GCM10022236_35210 [Microlunatus ginsengisoli]|uniref:Uncharacterized protein n=1 Tax=Microlunatus ginsengisoli TaxID=363863 RepID=A0ABP7ADS4_9ACTN